MKKHLILPFLLCIIRLSASGQVIPPPPFIIRTDTATEQVIPDRHVLYMEDASEKMDLAAARKAFDEGKFRPWSDSIAKKGLKLTTYWFYYRVENGTGKDYETALDSWANISDFHIIRAGDSVETHITGDRVPNSRKKEFKFNNVAPFRMKANESVAIFYKARFVNERFVKTFTIQLLDPYRHARATLQQMEPDIIPRPVSNSSFFSGIMMITALIYFVFFYLGREKVYLYFALMLIGMGINNSFTYELTEEYPVLDKPYDLLNLSGFYFLFLFCRHYLKTALHLPRWDRFLLIMNNLMLLVGFLAILLLKGRGDIAMVVMMLLNLACVVITFFLLGDRMQKEKKFLRYAITPLLVFIPFLFIIVVTVILTGESQAVNNMPWLIWLGRNNSIFIGVVITWMIISFSRILFRQFIEQRQRIQDQEKEKEKMRMEQELEKARLAEKQKEDLERQVAERTAELKQSLENLKATQAQLIQNEKMASLGEMTAGIAHEIQNPLNFVNNFAEVNAELAAEIKAELQSAVTDDDRRAALFDLLDNMAGNQEKIRLHGKRADNIVKNMLQHARTGSLQKEATDLNGLVDEYTKLSYHGLRAKDKSFNAGFSLELDPAIGLVQILPQDFGRVVLNLVNNAFYAVNERRKQGEPGYKPHVTVCTKALYGSESTDHNGMDGKEPGTLPRKPVSVLLSISDNGPGMPSRVKEKIFQPFFTTKPTGEGTGLGLSISYEIITKGHGGRIWAESTEGAGSAFSLEIPAGNESSQQAP